MGLMQYPKRAGWLYSHTSLTLLQGAEQFPGIQTWKISPKVEGRELIYANSSISQGRVRARLKIEVEGKWLLQSWVDWQKAHPQWLFELFNFTAVYEEGPDRVELTVIDLSFEETEMGSDGDDANTVTMKGMAAMIEIDGTGIADMDALGTALDVVFSIASGLGL